MSKKVALYWHNGRSLGHTSRSATIGEAVLSLMPGCSVIGITGASKGFELIPPGMDILKIPSYLAFDEEGSIRTSPVLNIPKGDLRNMRRNLITTFIQDFGPNALIVDYYPLGKNNELLPAIVNSPETKKILGLRGVLNSATETNEEFFNSQMIDFIQEHFSAILAYIDPQVFCLENYYQIPNTLLDMMSYTGYVTRSSAVKSITKQDARVAVGIDNNARVIVISFGGGQGTEPIWQALINGLLQISERFDFAYLSVGPYLETEAYERIRNQTVPYQHWVWTRLIENLPIWMKASDLFIGAGGYNSLAEIIATNCNALIIPRQLNELEQQLHSECLAQLNILRTTSSQDITQNKILTHLLEKCLDEPYPNSHLQLASDGAQQTASIIQTIVRG